MPTKVDACPTYDCQLHILSYVHTPDHTWLSCTVSTSSHGGRINEFCLDPLMHKGRVDLISSFDFAYRVYKQVLSSAGYITLVDTGEVFECFFMGAVGLVRALFKLDEQF